MGVFRYSEPCWNASSFYQSCSSLCDQAKPVGDLLLCAAHQCLFKKIWHCFFVVVDDHESVIIIGLKVNHFFCDVEKVQIGHSDAQLNMSTVSAQVPEILLLSCSFTEFEEKSSG